MRLITSDTPNWTFILISVWNYCWFIAVCYRIRAALIPVSLHGIIFFCGLYNKILCRKQGWYVYCALQLTWNSGKIIIVLADYTVPMNLIIWLVKHCCDNNTIKAIVLFILMHNFTAKHIWNSKETLKGYFFFSIFISLVMTW